MTWRRPIRTGGFDVAREQQLLRDHDTVVWQFPWHWYWVPGVLKEWMDQVLTYRIRLRVPRHRPAREAASASGTSTGGTGAT